jgi:hypothetical protein
MIKSISHHSNSIARQIKKEIGIKQFLLYDCLEYYLFRFKGEVEVSSLEFKAIIPYLEEYSLLDKKEIYQAILKFNEFDIYTFKVTPEGGVLSCEKIKAYCKKLSDSGKKSQKLKGKDQPKKIDLEKESEPEIKPNVTPVGNNGTDQNLINEVLKLALDCDFKPFQKIHEVTKLVSFMDHGILRFYLDSLPKWAKASESNTDLRFRDGKKSLLLHIKKAFENNIQLTGDLPSWVLNGNLDQGNTWTNPGSNTSLVDPKTSEPSIPEGIKHRELIPENWKEYFFWARFPKNQFSWFWLCESINTDFFVPDILMNKRNRDKFLERKSFPEWRDFFVMLYSEDHNFSDQIKRITNIFNNFQKKLEEGSLNNE